MSSWISIWRSHVEEKIHSIWLWNKWNIPLISINLQWWDLKHHPELKCGWTVTGVRPESITTTFLLLTLVCWQSTLKCFGSLMVSGCTYFLCEVYRWFWNAARILPHWIAGILFWQRTIHLIPYVWRCCISVSWGLTIALQTSLQKI